MVEPLNMLSKPLGLLRDMIANSATFQSWVGAIDATTAKPFIHFIRPPNTFTRPLALIDFGKEYNRQRTANDKFEPSGDIDLTFEEDITPANTDNWQDAAFTFTNQIGKIIEEIEAVQGVNPFLSIRAIEKRELMRSFEDEDDTLGDFYLAKFEVNWGV